MGTVIPVKTVSRSVYDYLMNRRYVGKVYSVYHTAANVLTPQGRLIGISGKGEFKTPFGIILNLPWSSSLMELGIKVGMDVSRQGNMLLLNSSNISFTFESSDIWDLQKVIKGSLNSKEILRNNLHLARKLVRLYNHGQGLGESLFYLQEILSGRTIEIKSNNVIITKGIPYIKMLVEAFEDQNKDSFAKGAEGLLGLGPGLTPSGDDFLTGFLGACHLLSQRAALNKIFLGEIGKMVLQIARERTTFLSQEFLRYAVRGELSELLSILIEAILVSSGSEVIKAASTLLKMGETSGADALAGIIFALEAGLRRILN